MRIASIGNAVLLLLIAGFLVRLGLNPPTGSSSDYTPVIQAVAKIDAFGMPVDSLRLKRRTVRRDDTFSDLLNPYNVSFETIGMLAERARPVFDVRRLQPGKEFRVYHEADSLESARVAIYAESPISYVVFDLRDSLQVYAGQRPTTTVTRTVSGRISSSLYETLLDLRVDPLLAVRLSEVFAWQIDFYRLQNGDRFTVAFEETLLGSKRVGLGRVLAARLHHGNREYTAFLYSNQGKDEYFDRDGESMRKAFLVAPVEYSRISSRYSGRRFHPVQKRYKAHRGTDFAAAVGTPIRATGEGTVMTAGYGRSNGNWVKIKHNGTYSTGYLHMSRIASGIRPGATVRQGQVIGYVGSTGLANGPHVCYRFWKNGAEVDHLREDFPSVDPLIADDMPAYLALRDEWLDYLERPFTYAGPSTASLLP